MACDDGSEQIIGGGGTQTWLIGGGVVQTWVMWWLWW